MMALEGFDSYSAAVNEYKHLKDEFEQDLNRAFGGLAGTKMRQRSSQDFDRRFAAWLIQRQEGASHA